MWNKYDGECNAAVWLEKNKKVAKDGLAIIADAHDDSGLYAKLITGPEFGCIYFLSKRGVK